MLVFLFPQEAWESSRALKGSIMRLDSATRFSPKPKKSGNTESEGSDLVYLC